MWGCDQVTFGNPGYFNDPGTLAKMAQARESQMQEREGGKASSKHCLPVAIDIRGRHLGLQEQGHKRQQGRSWQQHV